MNRRYDLFQLYRKAAQLIHHQDPTREIALALIEAGEAMLALVEESECTAGEEHRILTGAAEVLCTSSFQREGD